MSARLRGVWRVAGASVPGAGHLRSGLPCQDAHACQELEDGVLVAAVADGAGSAARAEEGARVAVRAAVEQAATIWEAERPRDQEAWGRFIQATFEAARAKVRSAAQDIRRPMNELATTLLLAVGTPEQTVAGQVGDGAVVALFTGDDLVALTRPPRTEHLNETTFLTSDDWLSEMRFGLREEPARGLALLSDGLQMLALKMPQGDPHLPFFAPLLKFTDAAPERALAEERLRAFLQSPGVVQRTDDDVTLLLAVRRPAR